MPILENWNIYRSFLGKLHLSGYVYEDKRFRDGEQITTSQIEKYNPENNTIQTKNTLYKLGQRENNNNTLSS